MVNHYLSDYLYIHHQVLKTFPELLLASALQLHLLKSLDAKKGASYSLKSWKKLVQMLIDA